VAEALHFSAHLRLPTTVEKETRNAFVEEVRGLGEAGELLSVGEPLKEVHTLKGRELHWLVLSCALPAASIT
jgi:hypothetical protein